MILTKQRAGTLCRLSFPLALIASLGAAGCAGPGASSTPAAGPGGARTAATRTKDVSFQVFTAGQTPGLPSNAAPQDLALGPDGSIWFTDPSVPGIGRISGGTVTEFTTGLPANARPFAIAPGPDGNMWFSDYRGVAIGRVAMDGTITEYDNPKVAENASGIAFGADGKPWVLVLGPKPMLAHLTAQGKVAVTKLPLDLSPDGSLTSDASGNMWFMVISRRSKGVVVERLASGGLVKYNTQMNKQLLPCCPHLAPKRMTIGSDGHPWFTTLGFGYRLSGAHFLGTIDAGKVERIRITKHGTGHPAYPSGLAAGTNGLWITGGNPLQSNGELWFVDAQGKQTPYDVPYNPVGLAVDGQGNPWFSAQFGGQPNQIIEAIVR